MSRTFSVFALSLFVICYLAVEAMLHNSSNALAGQRGDSSRAFKPKRFIKHDGRNIFVHGVNIPWFDGQYDHDIGPNVRHPNWGIWYNSQKVNDYFKDIRQIGFNVARVWVFEGAEGLKFDDNGYVDSIDSIFLQNLDDLIRNAQEHQLMLYLCLLSSWKDIQFPSPVEDASAREAYIAKAVAPLTKRYRGEALIFAFDIFNEIESECAGRDGNWTDEGATLKQARDFIEANVRAIKREDSKRLVSCSSGWHDWKNVQKGHYRGLGLDFYDIHVYRDDGFLPDVRELNADKPVIVGEFGQSGERWDDEIQRNADISFIENAVRKGYAGFLVWTYGHNGTSEVHSLLGKNGEHRPVVHSIRELIAELQE